jgi:hypothetical protein
MMYLQIEKAAATKTATAAKNSRNAREGREQHSEILPEATDLIPLKDLAGYVAIRIRDGG